METTIKLIAIVLLLMIGISKQSLAQKNISLTNPDEITEAAVKYFEYSLKEGELFKLAEKHQITGAYEFDVTIRERGEVASVFVVDREGGSLAFQNLVKDAVMKMKLGFKMQKGKRYKINYKFQF
ncbi:MAG: hypothetical protein VR77_03675 [Flavobacteriales bacterium BRH_c54]|nr:MAG: hypothetical protein VR77_03675 [Flavobacteriales bacterium BRH_c54]